MKYYSWRLINFLIKLLALLWLIKLQMLLMLI